MNGKTKRELTAEAVVEVLEKAKPASVAALAHGLGYSGSVSSWLRAKLVGLVPDLEERIARNKGSKEPQAADDAPKGKQESSSAGGSDAAAGQKAAKAAKTATPKPPKKAAGTEYPRAAHNRFREGSAYATAFDVLAAAGGKGIERAKLVEEVARITSKSLKKAYFDVTVVASSRQDGRSHRCIARAADSYYVDRTAGGWLKLVVRDRI